MNQHIHILCHGDAILPSPLHTSEPAILSSVEVVAAAPKYSPLIHVPGRFLRLDENGIELPAGTAGHAIVRDLALDLDWLVAYPAGDALPHSKAMEAAASVRIGGHTDWRAPTLPEQLSIVRYDLFNPATDVELFPGAKSGWHWTASPDASDPDCAWGVGFSHGYAGLYHRDARGFVRAVRSVAPASAARQ